MTTEENVLTVAAGDIAEGFKSSIVEEGAGSEPAKQPATPPATPAPAATPPAAVASEPGSQTPPPVVPPANAAPSYFKEVFGKDELTKEELIALKEAGEERERLKAQVDEFSKQPKVEYANDYVKALNEFMAKGGTAETFNKIQTVNAKEMPFLDAIRLETKLANQELTDEEIDVYLRDQYPLDTEKDENGNIIVTEEGKLAAIHLKLDGTKARKSIADRQIETSIPEPQRVQLDNQKRIESWTPHIKPLVESSKSLDISFITDHEKKTQGGFKFTLDDDPTTMAELEKGIRGVISMIPAQTDENGRKAVADATRRLVIVQAFPKIAQAIYDQAKSDVMKANDLKVHNPSAVVKGDTPASTVTISAEDAHFNMMKNRLEGKE